MTTDTNTVSVRAGDIYISGGRATWAERAIHFGTRKGVLGLVLGPIFIILGILFGMNVFLMIALGVWVLVSAVELEGRSWADHAMMFVDDGVLGYAQAIESSYSGGCVRLTTPKGSAPRYRIWRPADLSEYGRARLVRTALTHLGEPYRMKLNVAFGLDYLLGLGLFDVFVFRRFLVAKKANVCSVFVWRVFQEELGLDFGQEDPRRVSPDTLDDFCSGHPGEYSRVL